MKTPDSISYSDGHIVKTPVICVWEDLHNERAGFFRAFWCASPDATTGSPIIGYCSAGGSHRTVSSVAAEARRLYSDALIYRNGRIVK